MNNEQDTRERLTRLWLEVVPSVQAYVFSVIDEYQSAEDVVQQVALTVAKRFDEYDDSRHLSHGFFGWRRQGSLTTIESREGKR